jgi:ankyrin repeat protein
MKTVITSLLTALITLSAVFSQAVEKNIYFDKYYQCVYWNNKSKAEKLIEKGYGIDSRNDSGMTILMYCLKINNLDFAEFLIDAGANVNLCDNKGNFCLHYAIENCPDEKIVYKLIEKGANPDVVNNQDYSPFHFSILFNCSGLPFYFIEKGVNYKRITALNENALHLSLETGCDTLTSFLLDQNINLHLVDNSGYSPLLVALKYGRTRFASRLIEMDADIDARDLEGNSCLYYSIVNFDSVNMSSLLSRGADVNQDEGRPSLLMVAADVENTYAIEQLLRKGVSDSLPCVTHEDYYNAGLILSVRGDMADKDSVKIRLYEEAISKFREAKNLYNKRLNELSAIYTGETILDIFALGSALITGYDYDMSDSEANEAERGYYEERIMLCSEKISQLVQKIISFRNPIGSSAVPKAETPPSIDL